MKTFENIKKEISKLTKIFKEEFKGQFPQNDARYAASAGSAVVEQAIHLGSVTKVKEFCEQHGYDEQYTEAVLRRWFITKINKLDFEIIQYYLTLVNHFIKAKGKQKVVLPVTALNGRTFNFEFQICETATPKSCPYTDDADIAHWFYENGRAAGRTSDNNRIYLMASSDDARLNFDAKWNAIIDNLFDIKYNKQLGKYWNIVRY